MKASRRNSTLLIAFSLLVVVALSTPLALAAAKSGVASTGKPCSKAGAVTKSGTHSLKCVKSGKKLLWQLNKAAKPAPSKATVAPASSAAPSSSPTMTLVPAQSAYDITVASSQWNFAFSYFVDGSKTALHSPASDSSVLYLPEGALVHFTLTSADTTHGFWVPGLSIDNSMDPGVAGHLDFTASKLGTFPGRCNVSSCGRGHAGMAFTVKVVSAESFLKYISSLK